MATETTETTKQDIKFVWCSYDVFTMFYADGDFNPSFEDNTITKLDDHYRLVHVPVCGQKVENGKTQLELYGGTWGEKKWPAKIWVQLDDGCWTDLKAATRVMMKRCLEHIGWGLNIVYELLNELDKVEGDFQQPVHDGHSDFADFFMTVQSSMGLRFGYAQQNMLKVLQQHRRLLLQEKGAE